MVTLDDSHAENRRIPMTGNPDDRGSSMTPGDDDRWGPAEPAAAAAVGTGISSRNRRWRRTASAAVIVAVLVIGNAAQATAAVPGGRTAASPKGTGAEAATAGAALHGEFKVLNGDGSAQLRRWQSGQVGAIDNLSLTVHSDDGFDGQYLLGPGVSVNGIRVGDDVTVVGAGQSITADA